MSWSVGRTCQCTQRKQVLSYKFLPVRGSKILILWLLNWWEKHSGCCCLVCECPPTSHKGPCVKGWFSAQDATGRWWNLPEPGPNGRKLDHWEQAFEEDFESLTSLPPLFHCPAAMMEAISSTTHYSHDRLPHQRPKGNKANWTCTEISKTVSHDKYSL
jgi:hypothetical protein